MNLVVSFLGTDEAAVARFRAVGAKLTDSLVRAIYEISIRLQAYIVSQKLSGQVLHHRTGKLIGSIRVIPPQATSAGIEGRVEGAGGPASYGRIHEYGGVFSATRHSRVSTMSEFSANRSVLARSSTTYMMHFPMRSFMRTSFNETLQDAQARLAAAAQEGVA